MISLLFKSLNFKMNIDKFAAFREMKIARSLAMAIFSQKRYSDLSLYNRVRKEVRLARKDNRQ